MKNIKSKPNTTDTETEMAKHYSQKDANEMANEVLDLRKAIDSFFDKYNDIRGQVEGLVESESETINSLLSWLNEEGAKINIDATLKKIKRIDPEFESTWGDIMKHRGKLDLMVFMSEELKKILKPKRENTDGDL